MVVGLYHISSFTNNSKIQAYTMRSIFLKAALLAVIALGIFTQIQAQQFHKEKKHKHSFHLSDEGNSVGKKGELYLSWGYNKEWYLPSNIHIYQPKLGNDYTLYNTLASDHPGWNEGLFNRALTIPQYNYRLGYFFKDNWAIEANFDHTKFVVADNQLLHAKGMMNGVPVDTFINNRSGFMKYQLNNGANFLLINLVHRKHLTSFNKSWFDAALLVKGGAGIVIPHVQNVIDGHANKKGFQFGGFDMGFEAGIRATFFKYAYLEFTDKILAAQYYNLRLYEGRAKQFIATDEMILSIGASIPLIKEHKK